MIDNDVIRDIAAKRKYWFIPLDLGRAGILPSDNQEWCGVWLHGALLSIDTRAVFNPARNMVQSLYIVKDYTIRAMKIPAGRSQESGVRSQEWKRSDAVNLADPSDFWLLASDNS